MNLVNLQERFYIQNIFILYIKVLQNVLNTKDLSGEIEFFQNGSWQEILCEGGIMKFVLFPPHLGGGTTAA